MLWNQGRKYTVLAYFLEVGMTSIFPKENKREYSSSQRDILACSKNKSENVPVFQIVWKRSIILRKAQHILEMRIFLWCIRLATKDPFSSLQPIQFRTPAFINKKYLYLLSRSKCWHCQMKMFDFNCKLHNLQECFVFFSLQNHFDGKNNCSGQNPIIQKVKLCFHDLFLIK